jgi:hypothetical protein
LLLLLLLLLQCCREENTMAHLLSNLAMDSDAALCITLLLLLD